MLAGLLRSCLQGRLLWVPIPVWLALSASVALFLLAPSIDLWVSARFFETGVGFTSRGSPWERLVYHSVAVLMYGSGLALIGWCTFGYFRRQGCWRRCARESAYLLLLVALAPGLLVNALLKEHWGRARPVQVAEFGGSRGFSPAFVISDQGGASFSSGHAAAAASLVVFAWVLAARRRLLWVGLATAYALLVGFARLAAGGHFLSDILSSYLIVTIAAFVLYGSLFGESLLARGAGSRALGCRALE